MHCTLVVGPPGAGKSHYVEQVLRGLPFGMLWINPDALIGLLWGRITFTHAIRRIMRVLPQQLIEHAVEQRLSFVIETWGTTRRERARLLALPKSHGYSTAIVLLQVTPAIAIGRCKADKRRPRTTRWHELVLSWYRRFEPIGADEADEICEVAYDS